MTGAADLPEPPAPAGREASPAPGAALLAAACGALLLPLALAAAWPLLPPVLGAYLPLLELPVLTAECALAFAVLALPLFPAPRPDGDGTHPALTGLVRGAALGVLAAPFVLAGGLVFPLPPAGALAACLTVAVTGAGAAAAAAGFGSRGLAAALAAAALPGALAFFGRDLGLPLGFLARLSPWHAAAAAARGAAGWLPGLLPGLALLAATFAPRRRDGPA